MKPNNFNMVILPNGQITFVYADFHAPFIEKVGGAEITRASFVEPCPGGWYADMSPVSPGVVLGPFRLRSEALAAEEEFLNKKLFT
jgi:hypothetical protein